MKLIKNISPLDLNINYKINNNLNSLIGFGSISKRKNEQKGINNNIKIIKGIKTFYDKSLTIPAFKNIKNHNI